LLLLQKIVAWAMLLAGISVFLIRFIHAGPYAMPHQGNLLAAIVSLLIGLWLIRFWFNDSKLNSGARWLAVAISPVVLFFTLYAVFAEVEETVTLRVNDPSGNSVDLRLWIVDIEGRVWVTMHREKADAHGLAGARTELLRHGVFRCVISTQFDNRTIVNAAHHARHKKYATQRVATLAGMFGENAGANTVALRLDDCSTN